MSMQGVRVDALSPTVHPTCAMAGITEYNSIQTNPELITPQQTLAAAAMKTHVPSMKFHSAHMRSTILA